MCSFIQRDFIYHNIFATQNETDWDIYAGMYASSIRRRFANHSRNSLTENTIKSVDQTLSIATKKLLKFLLNVALIHEAINIQLNYLLLDLDYWLTKNVSLQWPKLNRS